jgi:hypothetical protein
MKPEARQISLFKRGSINTVPLEEFKELTKRRRPRKVERKLMDDIIRVAFSMGLPCIHIENFCGNTFVPMCDVHHRPMVCPVCQQVRTVTCRKILNKHLAGHFDIIGIAWTIETKRKTTKIKHQDPELDPRQEIKHILYKLTGVPAAVINEDTLDNLMPFLRSVLENRQRQQKEEPTP